jgi:hypothetical protein
MLNETHRAPPRYKIPEFFSSLLMGKRRREWSYCGRVPVFAAMLAGFRNGIRE